MVLVTTGWQSPRLVGQTACWTLRVGHCLLLALYVYYQVLKCSRRMFCLRCLSAAAMRALKRTTEPPAFARARVWVRSGTVWVRPPPCTPVSSHLAHLGRDGWQAEMQKVIKIAEIHFWPNKISTKKWPKNDPK